MHLNEEKTFDILNFGKTVEAKAIILTGDLTNANETMPINKFERSRLNERPCLKRKLSRLVFDVSEKSNEIGFPSI